MCKFIKYLIGKEKCWTIAIKDRKLGSNWKLLMDVNDRFWYADPMLVEYENKNYLFCERFDRNNQKGDIVCCEIIKSNIKSIKPVIIERFHLSYPSVFNINNDIFMIPETSEVNKIILYKAKKFPLEWEFFCEFEMDSKLVDHNIFIFHNKVFLLTSELNKNDLLKSKLRLFELDLNNRFIFESFDLKIKNNMYVYNSRGGGKIFFNDKNQMVRPVQVSKKNEYGYCLDFNILHIKNGILEEKLENRLMPDDININNLNIKGVHTYCINNNYEVIDIKIEVFLTFRQHIQLIKRNLRRVVKNYKKFGFIDTIKKIYCFLK